MTEAECRTITDRIDYILPHVKDDFVKMELRDIRFQCENAKNNQYVVQKKFEPDYADGKEETVAAAIQLHMATEVFITMIEHMGISIQDFLGNFMHDYDMHPEDVYIIKN